MASGKVLHHFVAYILSDEFCVCQRALESTSSLSAYTVDQYSIYFAVSKFNDPKIAQYSILSFIAKQHLQTINNRMFVKPSEPFLADNLKEPVGNTVMSVIKTELLILAEKRFSDIYTRHWSSSERNVFPAQSMTRLSGQTYCYSLPTYVHDN